MSFQAVLEAQPFKHSSSVAASADFLAGRRPRGAACGRPRAGRAAAAAARAGAGRGGRAARVRGVPGDVHAQRGLGRVCVRPRDLPALLRQAAAAARALLPAVPAAAGGAGGRGGRGRAGGRAAPALGACADAGGAPVVWRARGWQGAPCRVGSPAKGGRPGWGLKGWGSWGRGPAGGGGWLCGWGITRSWGRKQASCSIAACGQRRAYSKWAGGASGSQSCKWASCGGAGGWQQAACPAGSAAPASRRRCCSVSQCRSPN